MAKHLIPGGKSILAVKPGDGRARLSGGDGLYCLFFVKGGDQVWRFGYGFAGKCKVLSLGTYPDTMLKAARSKDDALRKLVSDGTDLSDTRMASKARQQASAEADARDDQGLPPAGSF